MIEFSKEEIPVPAPDWEQWDAPSQVTLEQAVMLSFNYCPDFFLGESIGKLLSLDPNEELFWTRLRRLQRYHAEATIQLSAFAMLAVSVFKWTPMPDQIKELATQPPMSPLIGVNAEKVWPPQKLAELRKKHDALKASGCRSPTKTLANKHKVSEQRIRKLLQKAKEKPLDGSLNSATLSHKKPR